MKVLIAVLLLSVLTATACTEEDLTLDIDGPRVVTEEGGEFVGTLTGAAPSVSLVSYSWYVNRNNDNGLEEEELLDFGQTVTDETGTVVVFLDWMPDLSLYEELPAETALYLWVEVQIPASDLITKNYHIGVTIEELDE